MKLKWSELFERMLRQETPVDQGEATIGGVEAAIEAGDGERAKELLEYARGEWEIVHDMYVNWSWAFFTYIQNTYGEEALEGVYRQVMGSYYRDRYDKVMSAEPETQLQLTVEGLRGHLMGSGRRGEVDVIDEGERWRIDMEPCGSGGAAISRIRSGTEEKPDSFGFSERAHDWTWGQENVCLYCGHCAFVNEILAIENYGHPMRITEYTGAADGSCAWYIYKDPRDIPAEYYERVGKTPPPDAPRLGDGGKGGECS